MKHKLLIGIIYVLVCLIFLPNLLSIYFSQDDFFHFKASLTDGSFSQFIGLFGFPAFEERGYAFYRPVFREGLYHIYYSIFGLEHIPFKFIFLSIHLVNIYLVYLFILRLFKSIFVSFFAASLFGLAAYNVGVLFYTAGGIETSGLTLFILATLLCFDKYLEIKVLKYKIFAFIFFLLSLGTHEIAAVLPLPLLGLIWIRSKSKDVVNLAISHLWLFGMFFLLYLYLDLVKIGFLQKEVQYKPVFSVSALVNTYGWYTGWALGLPEMLIDFVNPGFKLNPSLMRHWGGFFSFIFPSFFAVIAALGIMILATIVKKFSLIKDRRFIFLLVWFPAALLPVVFLPQHKFLQYLAPAMPAFAGILGYLIFNFWNTYQKNWSRSLVIIVIVSFVVLNFASIKLGSETYWASTRGRISQRLVAELKNKYPQIPVNSVIYFKNDPDYPYVAKDWGGTSKQASFVLNNQDAVQLIYNDFTLKTFYEDLGGVPQDFPESQVYEIIAKLD